MSILILLFILRNLFQLLKGRIVQIENESLEKKVELAEYENRLEEENKVSHF